MVPRNILLYGVSTPLGKRLAYYLDGWAEHRLFNVSLRTRIAIPATIGDIHDDMWQPLIGRGGVERPDMVIDCGSYDNANDPTTMWTTNTLRPVAVALAARTANIPFVFISTDRAIASDHPIPYGITMAHGETFTRQFHQQTTVIRLSDLYGFDVDVRPVKANKDLVSPTFIGEAAFLIARNLLEGEFTEGIVHCAPPFQDNMYDFFLRMAPQTAMRLEKSGSRKWGLVPTANWTLPGDPSKSWDEARREWAVHKYMRYW